MFFVTFPVAKNVYQNLSCPRLDAKTANLRDLFSDTQNAPTHAWHSLTEISVYQQILETSRPDTKSSNLSICVECITDDIRMILITENFLVFGYQQKLEIVQGSRLR